MLCLPTEWSCVWHTGTWHGTRGFSDILQGMFRCLKHLMSLWVARISPFPLWPSGEAQGAGGYSQRFSIRACKHLHMSWTTSGTSVITKYLYVST